MFQYLVQWYPVCTIRIASTKLRSTGSCSEHWQRCLKTKSGWLRVILLKSFRLIHHKRIINFTDFVCFQNFVWKLVPKLVEMCNLLKDFYLPQLKILIKVIFIYKLIVVHVSNGMKNLQHAFVDNWRCILETLF